MQFNFLAQKRIKRFIFNPWTIGISTSLIAVLISKIIEWLWGFKVILAAKDFIKFIILEMYLLLNLKIPLFIFLLGLFIFTPIFIKIRTKNRLKPTKEFLSYKEDTFEGVLYRWKYYKSKKGKPYIGRIVKYCPDCVCRITSYKCQICNKSFLDIKSRSEIEALILYKIEKKYNVNEFDTLSESSRG